MSVQINEQRKLLEILLGESIVISASIFAAAAKPENGHQLAVMLEEHHKMIQMSVLRKLDQHGVQVGPQSVLRETFGRPENN